MLEELENILELLDNINFCNEICQKSDLIEEYKNTAKIVIEKSTKLLINTIELYILSENTDFIFKNNLPVFIEVIHKIYLYPELINEKVKNYLFNFILEQCCQHRKEAVENFDQLLQSIGKLDTGKAFLREAANYIVNTTIHFETLFFYEDYLGVNLYFIQKYSGLDKKIFLNLLVNLCNNILQLPPSRRTCITKFTDLLSKKLSLKPTQALKEIETLPMADFFNRQIMAQEEFFLALMRLKIMILIDYLSMLSDKTAIQEHLWIKNSVNAILSDAKKANIPKNQVALEILNGFFSFNNTILSHFSTKESVGSLYFQFFKAPKTTCSHWNFLAFFEILFHLKKLDIVPKFPTELTENNAFFSALNHLLKTPTLLFYTNNSSTIIRYLQKQQYAEWDFLREISELEHYRLEEDVQAMEIETDTEEDSDGDVFGYSSRTHGHCA